MLHATQMWPSYPNVSFEDACRVVETLGWADEFDFLVKDGTIPACEGLPVKEAYIYLLVGKLFLLLHGTWDDAGNEVPPCEFEQLPPAARALYRAATWDEMEQETACGTR